MKYRIEVEITDPCDTLPLIGMISRVITAEIERMDADAGYGDCTLHRVGYVGDRLLREWRGEEDECGS